MSADPPIHGPRPAPGGDPSLDDRTVARTGTDPGSGRTPPDGLASAQTGSVTAGTTGPLTGPVEIDGLQIGDQLGRGGFSVVYRAVQEQFARTVAVKVFALDPADTLTVEPFLAEARNIGELATRKDVVTVYDLGRTGDGRPYLVLQYLPGGSVADRLKTEGVLPVADALKVAAMVADVLVAAHGRGVLHCDLKPANVLYDAEGAPVLADFGIARATAAVDHSRSMAFLTPDHAAPELWNGEPPSTATDIYALGSMLFQMLTGHAPFQAATGARLGPVQVMRRTLSEPAPSLSTAGVPDVIVDLVDRMLAKDPGDRPASAGEVAAMLEPLVQGAGEFDDGPTRRRVPTAPGAGTDVDSDDGLISAPAPIAVPYAAVSTMESPLPDVGTLDAAPSRPEAEDALVPETVNAARSTNRWPIVVGVVVLVVGVFVAAGVVLIGRGDDSTDPHTSSTTSTSVVAAGLELNDDVVVDGVSRTFTAIGEPDTSPDVLYVQVFDAGSVASASGPEWIGTAVVTSDGGDNHLTADDAGGFRIVVSSYLSSRGSDESVDPEQPLPPQRLCFGVSTDPLSAEVATTVCDPAG